MTGKCPKCEKLVTTVKTESVTVGTAFQPQFRGLGLTCPYCQTILGVSIDPISLKVDTVNEVMERLKKGR